MDELNPPPPGFRKDIDIVLRRDNRGYLACLTYDSNDPHVVLLCVLDGRLEVVWEFDRQLLRDGLTGPAGTGDIRVRPSPVAPSRLLIRLTSPHGDSTFSTAIALVEQFVTRIYAAVPEGHEHRWIDMDLEIAALLEQT